MEIRKLYRISGLILLGMIALVDATAQQMQGFSKEKEGIVKEVEVINARTIHVRTYPKGQPQKKSLVVDEKAPFKEYQVREENGQTLLETSALQVRYNPQTGNINFFRLEDKDLILSEKSSDFEHYEVLNDKAYHVSQTFTLSDTEALYGLGQFQEGILNYRNQKVNLVHANREIANPVLLSTNNYLLYWDNYSKTVFKDDKEGMNLWSEVGDAVDYYFVYGSDMNDAIAGFRDLTGHSPMLPKSAFGFWMSKERYRSFDELTGVVAEYRKRGIPLDNIVQDWQYWGQDMELWNSLEFNPENFADPKKVIDKLHQKYNVKLTLSVWPAVGKKTKVYEAMEKEGVLFDVPTWAGYKVIDIYHPKAREIYWDYLYRGLYLQGVDSWWMDATEPSFRDGLYQSKQEEWTKKAGMTAWGPFHRYLNTYSLVMSEMMFTHLREVSNKRVSLLTRSAFAGQQKYATSTWSGDIYASWSIFKKQIPAGLNLCMTGIPYWTTDIGAFRVISSNKPGEIGAGEISDYVNEAQQTNDGGYKDGLKDPAYLELYTRWFQYGTFNPMFRAHGTEVPREIWHFGEPGTPYYDAQIKMIDLRYSLLSYIYSSAWDVTSKGGTMMRALAMDFTADTRVFNNADGYMFGEALLVYPVTRPMYYDRKGEIKEKNITENLYLPNHNGQFWYDLYTGKRYVAGKEIGYNAPLDVIPVFVKGGTIMPRNKVVQYVGATDNREMDIYIYPGKDASFILYEDDNETYDYEQGSYSIIEMEWNESERTFTVMKRSGEYPGMLKVREFTIHFVDNEKKQVITKMKYTGDTLKVKI